MSSSVALCFVTECRNCYVTECCVCCHKLVLRVLLDWMLHVLRHLVLRVISLNVACVASLSVAIATSLSVMWCYLVLRVLRHWMLHVLRHWAYESLLMDNIANAHLWPWKRSLKSIYYKLYHFFWSIQIGLNWHFPKKSILAYRKRSPFYFSLTQSQNRLFTKGDNIAMTEALCSRKSPCV